MQDRMPSLCEAVAKDIATTRRFPESTYRLQFHAGFTFRDALHIVPYLHALGITHCEGVSELLISHQSATPNS